ncbi:hypothetical protein BH09ACT5_BH09ACT5_00050 [soil metagenome]
MRSGVAQGVARGVGAACFLVLPALLLGSLMTQAQAASQATTPTAPQAGAGASDGSSAEPTDSAPSLAEARDRFYALIDDAQQTAGGDWANQDDPDSRGCALPGGGSGRAFSALRIADEPVPAAAAAITSAWDDLGYSLERTEIGPVTQLVATREGGQILIFRVSDRAMTLQGESECRPDS